MRRGGWRRAQVNPLLVEQSVEVKVARRAPRDAELSERAFACEAAMLEQRHRRPVGDHDERVSSIEASGPKGPPKNGGNCLTHETTSPVGRSEVVDQLCVRVDERPGREATGAD